MPDTGTGSGGGLTGREAAVELLTIPYCPLVPTDRQAVFLCDIDREALYGGAAGGGKSVALLMAALQFVDLPGYAALILRPTLTEAQLASGLLGVAQEWIGDDAQWSRDIHTFKFPSGATLTFGYLDNVGDERRYLGSEYQYIGFDELTQFTENAYRYLFSRLRRPSDPDNPLSGVPLRMRSATNPGGDGHDWVRRTFVIPHEAEQAGGPLAPRRFHPAFLVDNPHLDTDAYRRSLDRLDPITRAQLLDGDWDIRPEGRMFQRHWFTAINAADVPEECASVRYWDLAATPASAGTDPDYTVGALVGRHGPNYYVRDIVRLRATPRDVERAVRATAERDGPAVSIYIEQEPASAGKAQIDHYRTDVLDGYEVRGDRPSGNKIIRAGPVAARAEAGELLIMRSPWNDGLIDEFGVFPDGAHDDQVDAVAGAINILGHTSWHPKPVMPGGETRVAPLSAVNPDR